MRHICTQGSLLPRPVLETPAPAPLCSWDTVTQPRSHQSDTSVGDKISEGSFVWWPLCPRDLSVYRKYSGKAVGPFRGSAAVRAPCLGPVSSGQTQQPWRVTRAAPTPHPHQVLSCCLAWSLHSDTPPKLHQDLETLDIF